MILSAGNAGDREKLRKILQLSKRAVGRAKPSKYGNEHTFVDGKKFHSKREAKRYGELKLLERAGEISDLECQRKYELRAAPFKRDEDPVKICFYVADFDYLDNRTDQIVTEDVKGCVTALFKIKAALFKANYGREIRVVK